MTHVRCTPAVTVGLLCSFSDLQAMDQHHTRSTTASEALAAMMRDEELWRLVQ